MKKVLVYYRHFGKTLGGGEYLPLTFISEMQKVSEVTLALNWTENVESAAEFFGIEIDFSKLKTVKVMPENFHDTNNSIWLSFYRFRKLKKLAKEADLCISLANIMDFGKPAHHFLITLDLGDSEFAHYLKTGRQTRRSPGAALKNFINTTLRHLLGMRTKREIICDPEEHIYPNSNFVDKQLRDFYGTARTRVFYPPTIFDMPVLDVPRDPLKVVYIGRVAPSKRIEDIIEIVKLARERSGENITLEIAGHLLCGDYRQKLEKCAGNAGWVKFPGILFGEKKAEFLLSGSFAVHTMTAEAFGISITEYLKAGLIPVVPDIGGACEVVGSPELSFRTNEDAAGILVKLLRDPEFRERQSRYCAKRAERFSKQIYLENQHQLLAEILGAAGPAPESNSEFIKTT